jgi:hypothetical protein
VYRCRCCCCKDIERRDLLHRVENGGLSIYSAHSSMSSRATDAAPSVNPRASFAQRQSQRFRALQQQIEAAENNHWLKRQVRLLKTYCYQTFFSSRGRSTAACLFTLFSCAFTTYAAVRIQASVDKHQLGVLAACQHMAQSKPKWVASLTVYWTLVLAVAPLALWLLECRKGKAAAAAAAREGTQMMSGGGGGGGGSSSPWGSGDAYTRESGTTRSSRRRVGAEGLSDAAMDRLLAQQDAAMTAPPEPEPEPEIELY